MTLNRSHNQSKARMINNGNSNSNSGNGHQPRPAAQMEPQPQKNRLYLSACALVMCGMAFLQGGSFFLSGEQQRQPLVKDTVASGWTGTVTVTDETIDDVVVDGLDERRRLLEVPQDPYALQPMARTPEEQEAALVAANGDKILHVIKTRFMQHQPDLVELGLARLKLFQTFTLPAMEAQINKGFTWLIRTDPLLHEDLKRPFLDCILNSTVKDRVILFAQNSNPGSFHQSSLVNETDVWIGSLERYQNLVTQAKQKEIAVLETSLDADDAIPHDFIDYIHREAVAHLTDPKDWMYWCTHYHMEWQVTAEKPPSRRPRRRRRKKNAMPELNTTTSPYGHVMTRTASKCITAGLTVLYGSATSRADLPGTMVHTRIEEMIPACEDEQVEQYCFRVMFDSRPGALRARTPTSTGMSQVRLPTREEEEKSQAFLVQQRTKLAPLWDSIEREYGMNRQLVEEARRLLLDRVSMIASDNLKGQCTVGHSCKEETQQVLKSLAAAATPQET